MQYYNRSLFQIENFRCCLSSYFLMVWKHDRGENISNQNFFNKWFRSCMWVWLLQTNVPHRRSNYNMGGIKDTEEKESTAWFGGSLGKERRARLVYTVEEPCATAKRIVAVLYPRASRVLSTFLITRKLFVPTKLITKTEILC